MIRVVFDANVFVSGVLGFRREESAPGALLRAWRGSQFTLIVSNSLISEIEHALSKPYMVRNLPIDDQRLAIAALNQQAQRVEISVPVIGIASHPEDDLVLAAAASANVDYLVTGDKMLLQLGSYQNIAIINPKQFLAVLDLDALWDR